MANDVEMIMNNSNENEKWNDNNDINVVLSEYSIIKWPMAAKMIMVMNEMVLMIWQCEN